MKTHTWFALGLVLLITAHAPISGAVDIKHGPISKTIISYTEERYGPEAASRVVAWNDLVMNHKNKPIAEKLQLTNNFFNRIPLRSDIVIGSYEHWSTPFEMLTHNAGSHADHAVGKYVTLEALGVSIDHLQITHVHSTAVQDPQYMVLIYYSEPNAMPLVLDTVIGEIKPANERNDLFPHESFNNDGLWLPREPEDGRDVAQIEAVAHIETVDHIELWNELNARMNKELLSIQYPDKEKLLNNLK